MIIYSYAKVLLDDDRVGRYFTCDTPVVQVSTQDTLLPWSKSSHFRLVISLFLCMDLKCLAYCCGSTFALNPPLRFSLGEDTLIVKVPVFVQVASKRK